VSFIGALIKPYAASIDMAMFLFTDAILNNRPIKVFNQGELYRDFTYINDIVNGVVATIEKPNQNQYSIYNIGNSKPIKLIDFVHEIESNLGIEAQKEMLPMQPGDVERTWADVSNLQRDYNYKPTTDVKTGVGNFIEWYKTFYLS
jgi:UDP-glucuronate 4-epimerase